AATMLPYLELHDLLLAFALKDRLKRQPTRLGQPSTAVRSPGFPELVAALRQLHSKRCVLIRKFKTEWHNYDMFTGTEPDNDFFYTGGFEMSITPDGREYIEVIHESKQAEEKQIVKPTERDWSKNFASFSAQHKP